jgi:hypothetical protein
VFAGAPFATSPFAALSGNVYIALINESAAGAIIEFAGRTSGGTGSGIQFITNLTDEIKNPSRLIWRAVDERKRSAQMKTLAALDDAKAILQKNLDRERE